MAFTNYVTLYVILNFKLIPKKICFNFDFWFAVFVLFPFRLFRLTEEDLLPSSEKDGVLVIKLTCDKILLYNRLHSLIATNRNLNIFHWAKNMYNFNFRLAQEPWFFVVFASRQKPPNPFTLQGQLLINQE